MSFAWLQLRGVRVTWVRTGLSVIGVAIGVMLVVAVLGLSNSLTSSVDRLADLAGRAPLEVQPSTDAGFDDTLLDEIESTDGVTAAVPAVRTTVLVEGEPVLLLGVDGRAAALSGPGALDACAAGVSPEPDAEGGLYVSERLEDALGGADTVSVGAPQQGTESVQVAGVVACAAVDRLNQGYVAVAPLDLAQSLSGKEGRFDVVYVVDDGGDTEAVRRRLNESLGGEASVASPRQAVEQARSSIEPLVQGTNAVSALALIVGASLLFNNMSTAAIERRQQLALLRAVGARRRTVLGAFVFEAAGIGVVGSVLGAVMGVRLTERLMERVPDFLIDAVGVRPSTEVPLFAVGAGVAIGIVVSVIAALGPALRATRVPVVEALRPDDASTGGTPGGVRWRLLVLGAAIALVGFSLAVQSEALAFGGLGLTQAGVLVMLFAAAPIVARACGVLARAIAPTGELAATAVQRAPRRTWATVAAVSLLVSIVALSGGVAENQSASLVDQYRSLGRTDFWVQTTPADNLPTQLRMPTELGHRLREVPGVDDVVAGQAGYLVLDGRRALVEAVDGPSNAPIVQATSDEGRNRLLRGDGVVVSRRFSDETGLGAGDTVGLPSPTGSGPVPVIEVVDIDLGGDLGLFAMSLNEFESRFGREGATWFEVQVVEGGDASEVGAELEAAVADAGHPTFVLTGAENQTGARSTVEQGLAIFDALQAAVLIAAALAVMNTLMISVVDRRRELGVLLAIGLSRRRLRRSIVLEAVAMAGVGGAIGVVVGMALHRLGLDAIGARIGITADYAFTPGPLMLAVGAAFIAAVGGAILPAIRASRSALSEVLSHE